MLRTRVLLQIAVLWNFLAGIVLAAEGRAVNWTGHYAACNQRTELLKREPMDLGVRFATSNAELERQFRLALTFWTEILDMRWHEEDSEACALQLVDGTPEILKKSIVARSQFTDWDNFQGWIAFNPASGLSPIEMYLTAVHEIGHMLGLKHNQNSMSVMYYLDLEGQEYLDASDLALLAGRHRIRAGVRARVPVVPRALMVQADWPVTSNSGVARRP